jgi:4-diphosphocytidyl-2-C-methyl-D-erythritol kinase
MECSDFRVPTDNRNTAFRAVEMALVEMGVTAEVHLLLTKNLPVQGGLGAGSANAAAALLGLERELGTALPGPQRMSLAEKIGSDVPLFLVGGTVYGHNRGQIVLPYPDLPEMHCVVFAPSVGSSTPLAFKAWDAHVSQLTPEAGQDRLNELSRVYASAFAPVGVAEAETGASGAFRALDGVRNSSRSESLAGNPLPALVRTGIANDFEEVVFQQHPFLRDILHALWGDDFLGESRAIVAALSGSGSSLFGLYRTEADAEAAQARTAGFAGRSFKTTTLNRASYWSSMFA